MERKTLVDRVAEDEEQDLPEGSMLASLENDEATAEEEGFVKGFYSNGTSKYDTIHVIPYKSGWKVESKNGLIGMFPKRSEAISQAYWLKETEDDHYYDHIEIHKRQPLKGISYNYLDKKALESLQF